MGTHSFQDVSAWKCFCKYGQEEKMFCTLSRLLHSQNITSNDPPKIWSKKMKSAFYLVACMNSPFPLGLSFWTGNFNSLRVGVFMCSYMIFCLIFLFLFFFSLANCIALLQANSLAATIKQLCFVVMVRKILFKIRLLSNEPTKKNRRSALAVRSVEQTASVSTLIPISQNVLKQTCSFQTWAAWEKFDCLLK